MAATQGIRPATEGELDLLPSVYERASFNPRLAAVDRFARAALGGEVFVVERASGLALIEATAGRLNGAELSLSIPQGNEPAIRALEARGQTERSRTTRMRLGPPLPWRPRAVFSTFNLFWG